MKFLIEMMLFIPIICLVISLDIHPLHPTTFNVAAGACSMIAAMIAQKILVGL